MKETILEVPSFVPKKGLRRKVSLKKTKKKKTKVDLWREFGLTRPAKPRYSGLRGVLWLVLSQYVRARDKALWGAFCVNCGLEKEEFHGGHYIATGSCGWDGLALDEKNVHAECSSCNFRDKQKLKYGFNLDIRYGVGTADKLRERYQAYIKEGGKNWNNQTYREEINHYQQLLAGLNSDSVG